MLLFIDGEIIQTTVEQNIDAYYQAYILEFGEISRTQWEGSKEYEVAYSCSQRDFQNDTVFQQTLEKTLTSITEINQQIARPAVLHSRVAERFAEDDFIATIRVADDLTKGVVAICVDYTSDAGGALDQQIADIIVLECLPAGQHMIGAVSLPVTISNGQSVTAQWAEPVQHDVDWKITLTVDQNSPFPVDDVDTIVEKFLANFNEQNSLGRNITPQTYYQIARDAPWASDIESTYELDAVGGYVPDIYLANYDDKFNATLTNANVTILGL